MAIIENISGPDVASQRDSSSAPCHGDATLAGHSSGLNRLHMKTLRAVICVVAGLAVSTSIVTQAHAQSSAISLPLDSQWSKADDLPGEGALKRSTAQSLSPVSVNGIERSVLVPDTAVGLDRLSVGVGDQIFITVFGQPDMSAEVTVNENQQVTLPLVGTIRVGAMTPSAIEKLIAKRLKDGEYLRNPEVSVQVRQVRSQMISVLGEVQRPGRFPILGKLTVLDAIATAGGLSQRADRTVFLLRRNPLDGGAIQRREIAIHLDSVLDASKGELDLELKHEDVVFVAQQKMFYVHGEVRRPGAYPIEPDLNIMRVLSISGGVTERGSLRRIRIHRKGPDDKSVQELTQDLTAPVRSGDVIHVDERLF